MSYETTTQKNIGPAAIAKSGINGGPNFALSATEWIAIQTYVIDGLALPTTMEKFKASLGSGAPADLSDFDQLVSAYATIYDHVSTWQNTTYPATVSLASDIFNYAQQAPTYYNPILPLAQKLTDDPTDEQTKAELKAILGKLSSDASTNHDKAAAVSKQIQTFAQNTQSDKTVLSGTDGKGGLVKYYNDKLGANSQAVKDLTQDITAQTIILNAANKEYNHDVIVAATTPTYGWIFPVGTIAAAVVAGIYGHKAVEALDRAHAAQDKINTFSAELAADTNLMLVINSAESGIKNILGDINAALPIIQKIQGVWGAISDDLNAIVGIIDEDIAKALPIIMNLGVEAAIKAWTNVGQEANAYRVNAYVTVNS